MVCCFLNLYNRLYLCIIHLFLLGDVEAMLIFNGKNGSEKTFKMITKLHTIKHNKKERERLEKASKLQFKTFFMGL